MAAVYLHNALYAPNSSDTRNSAAHSRNLSSISNATLLTSTTQHSHPNEPLLPSSPDQATAEAYYDQISRQPRNDDGTPARLRWDGPMLTNNPSPVVEKGKFRRRGRKPKQRWKRLKLFLELIMAAWATYNTVRYFLAFTIFRDSIGQAFCLALGISAGFSFSFAICAFVFSILRQKLRFGLSNEMYSHIRSFLQLLSSFCLLGPAAVNFSLAFIWRTSSNPSLNIHNRCSLDIDVVWSVRRNACSGKSPSWGLWITLSSIRLAMTLAVIVAYHSISFLHRDPPRRSRQRHFRSESRSSFANATSPTAPIPSLSVRQPSDSTLDATLVDTASRSRVRLARSRSSEFSGEGSTLEHASFGRSGVAEPGEADHGMTGFVDRFRSLISQITQETEEALEIARSDGAPSPATSPDHTHSPGDVPPAYIDNYNRDGDDDEYDDDDDDDDDDYDHARNNDHNMFNLPPMPPALGYNEFGLPYPPDENIRVMNGFIRRMPTIESMGSGEINSQGASSHRPTSIHTSSRPPTRNTLLSWTSTDYEAGSNPPSRSNSLSARVEMLVGMSPITPTSEHGELLGRADSSARRQSTPSTPSSAEHPFAAVSNGTHETQSTTGSRSTAASYHTATMGSSADTYPPGLYHDGMLYHAKDRDS